MMAEKKNIDYLSKILDMREYDVPLHVRIQIDNEIRCSYWYKYTLEGVLCKSIEHLAEKLDKADLRVMAYDIETTKEQLKFPDASQDEIMMISYIIDGNGFLITNRQVVSEDVDDFEYAPTAEYDVGTFVVFNEPDERALIQKFFDHIIETKPFVITSFNGDFFDWPFVHRRALYHQISMEDEIGVYNSKMG
jgi:DNA polymerase epsilon subunit 1